MPLKLHPHITDRRTRAINILSAVGLQDRTHYYPDLLSGGQKQRVALAKPLLGTRRYANGTRIARALVSQWVKNIAS